MKLTIKNTMTKGGFYNAEVLFDDNISLPITSLCFDLSVDSLPVVKATMNITDGQDIEIKYGKLIIDAKPASREIAESLYLGLQKWLAENP